MYLSSRIRIHTVIAMITMTEIARLTHVSQPTVSRVLNGSQTVAPEIRERVLACAKEHDYQFNALAKGLQGSKTQLLGVLVTDISNGFFADLAKQIETAARKRGYSIILFNSDYNPQNEQEYLDVVRRYRVDGVLAVPIRETSAEWQEYVKKLDVPIVTVTRRAKGLDSVYVDHIQAGSMVASHLLEQGFRRRVVPELQHLVPVLGHGQFFIAVAPDGHECRALLLGEAGDGGFVRLIAGHS